MSERLPNKYLPDFISKKIDMLEAANMFKKAIDKIAIEQGMDPEWETLIKTYDKFVEQGNDKSIVVGWEAGPHDWGVAYSLGSNPKSYTMDNNIQDWYLECHYGFDVIFTPKDFDNAKSYHSVVIENKNKEVPFKNYIVKENTISV